MLKQWKELSYIWHGENGDQREERDLEADDASNVQPNQVELAAVFGGSARRQRPLRGACDPVSLHTRYRGAYAYKSGH